MKEPPTSSFPMKKRPLDALFLWCAHIAYVIFDILYVCACVVFFLLLQIFGNTALVRCSHTQNGLKIERGIVDGSDFPSFL